MDETLYFLEERLVKFSRFFALAGSCIGLLGFIGWYSGIQMFRQLVASAPSMTVNTSISTIFIGLAAFILQPGLSSKPLRLLGCLLALASALIGLGVLAEYVGKINLGLDLFPDPSLRVRFPGRPAPETALTLFLIASSLLTRDLNNFLIQRLSFVLNLLSIGLPTLILTGYFYGEISLYSPFLQK